MKEEKTDSFASRFYNWLTAPKTVKIGGYGVLILYIGLVAIGVLIAALFDPDGYSITTNWISDLGVGEHTPAPFLYDIACICAGIMTIPFHFYLEKHLAPIPHKTEDYPTHRWAFRLMGLGWFISMIGSFFYIGVGIFSGDRAVPISADIDMHGLCSVGAFGGFTFAAIFIGIAFLFIHQDIIPKPYKYPIGLVGISVPLTVAILEATIGGPLLEWCLLFAILIWIIPVSLFTLRHAEKQRHNE